MERSKLMAKEIRRIEAETKTLPKKKEELMRQTEVELAGTKGLVDLLYLRAFGA